MAVELKLANPRLLLAGLTSPCSALALLIPQTVDIPILVVPNPLFIRQELPAVLIVSLVNRGSLLNAIAQALVALLLVAIAIAVMLSPLAEVRLIRIAVPVLVVAVLIAGQEVVLLVSVLVHLATLVENLLIAPLLIARLVRPVPSDGRGPGAVLFLVTCILVTPVQLPLLVQAKPR